MGEPGGRDPAISARIPRDVLARVESWAAMNDLSRSEAIGRLLEDALNASEKAAPDGCLKNPVAAPSRAGARPSTPAAGAKGAPRRKARQRFAPSTAYFRRCVRFGAPMSR
jgi:hypothetical protein